MSRNVAAAIIMPSNPFFLAAMSVRNCGVLLIDFLYGSEDRVRLTYALAIALLGLAYSISVTSQTALSVCAV